MLAHARDFITNCMYAVFPGRGSMFVGAVTLGLHRGRDSHHDEEERTNGYRNALQSFGLALVLLAYSGQSNTTSNNTCCIITVLQYSGTVLQ